MAVSIIAPVSQRLVTTHHHVPTSYGPCREEERCSSPPAGTAVSMAERCHRYHASVSVEVLVVINTNVRCYLSLTLVSSDTTAASRKNDTGLRVEVVL